MHKYFDLLLELLKPEEDDDFIVQEKKQLSAAWKKLEDRWDKKLAVHHKYWFIFTAYDDLLIEKISLDEFLATWDITSNRKLDFNEESSIDIVNSMVGWKLGNQYDNTLFILDSISFWVLAENDKKKVQSWVKDHNCEIVFC